MSTRTNENAHGHELDLKKFKKWFIIHNNWNHSFSNEHCNGKTKCPFQNTI